MLRLSRPLLNQTPKKRATRFWTKRRHLMQYLDHYRHLWKPRREHFDRRRQQEHIYKEDYAAPAFRYPGFWPAAFGFEKTQAVQALTPAGGDSLGARRGGGS
uniref:Uncharacterized protein n=1 Tax=Zooxanthella nutricula TaxID=1333877 RepID=A0A7S2NTU1_9DINO